MSEESTSVSLHEAARRRYLTYALSVIHSRALPDVRDGLKPVQRRILFAMFRDLDLTPPRPPRKCATVVGRVLGHYHPHGDQAVYDALVRMAQPFSMRYPLIEGIGNFGSLDGDPPAAFRYTECRLTPIAEELLAELAQETVVFRSTFDGQAAEPAALPARFPNLLVNGATGIAVGMATSIPPHNLTEVIKACCALIDNPELTLAQLMRHVKGPDFPTGGELLEGKETLRAIYETGSGTLRVQGQYRLAQGARGAGQLIVTSVPYMTNKAAIVAEIGRLIADRKVPQLTDVRDESTDEVRIVLELKHAPDAQRVMAYLYKHTQLRSRFTVNLTTLVPGAEDDGPLTPRRVGLRAILDAFLAWRFGVVKRRLEHRLRVLKERIHILEGFRKIFSALDEAIAIIRRSDGRDDAARKLRNRFALDGAQVDAILNMRLYRLARLEIQKILDELAEKRREAEKIERILASARRLWRIVRDELEEVAGRYGDARRTKLGASAGEDVALNDEDFIADEDAYVLVSRDGWVKRVGKVLDPAKTRLRQGDSLLSIIAGNTRSLAVFFSNRGSAYSIRINDIPPSRGYGDPIQRLFRFRDGERVVAAVSLDGRFAPRIAARGGGAPPPLHVLAINSGGFGLRFSLEPFAEVSTRTGRRFARLKDDEEIAVVQTVAGNEILCVATRAGKALVCRVSDISILSGPGRGVKVIGLAKGDRLLGAAVTTHKTKGLMAVSQGGRRLEVTPGKYRVTARGGRGFALTKRTGLVGVELPPPDAPVFPARDANGDSTKR